MADRSSERVFAVVQARMSSSRFSGKVLADIGGRPLLARLLERLANCREIAGIAVATSVAVDDDPVVRVAADAGAAVVRGPLDDVLERYRSAVDELGADAVVRITGDCPLVDPALVDDVVRLYRASEVQYASNIHPPTFPDGLDVEVVSSAALRAAARATVRLSEREHVTLYIVEHPEEFPQVNLAREGDASALRWTVDYPDDLEFIRAIFARFQGREDTFAFDEVLRALGTDDRLRRLMPGHERNEGLAISIARDSARENSGRNDGDD